MRRCDRVVVIGTYWHDFGVKEIGLDPGRVMLIHNGVPSHAAQRAKGDRRTLRGC